MATEPNAHYTHAVDSLGRAGQQNYASAQGLLASIALSQATVALAYEQRTANLIALLTARATTGDMRMVPELDGMIEERLGL